MFGLGEVTGLPRSLPCDVSDEHTACSRKAPSPTLPTKQAYWGYVLLSDLWICRDQFRAQEGNSVLERLVRRRSFCSFFHISISRRGESGYDFLVPR